jgi:lantibiotic leader peptide-processing serine protease
MRKVVSGLGAVLVATMLVAVAAAAASAAPRTTAYLVVFKPGHSGQGVKAVKQAGGKVLRINKVGVGTVVSSRPNFARTLRASERVVGVAHYAGWKPRWSKTRVPQSVQRTQLTPAQATSGCAAFFNPPPGVAGPDPLHVCQWGMHVIHATPAGSYAVNQGVGARVGILDTGIDAFHVDIAANLDTAHSCSFIKPGNPTALPQEIAPTGRACGTAEQPKWQDYTGHGTHVGGIVAAPINGIGVVGVAPRATLVGLKVCTAAGWCFTQEVVDAIIEAGDQRLDVANMSFFADPFLYNCRNEADQRTIVQAISRAAQYATQRGVTLVSSAGNQADDLDHPDEDPLSPDFPPGAAVTRPVGNHCVVVPSELPNVATISAIGPRKILASYSSVGNSKVDVTAPGGDAAQTPGSTFGRVLSSWSTTGDPFPASRTVDQCTGPGGTPPCFRWAWVSGTSMSSPHAAGVAALIRSRHPDLPPHAVQAILQNSAQPMACTAEAEAYTHRDCTGSTNPNAGGQTNFYGNGLVDALRAGTK